MEAVHRLLSEAAHLLRLVVAHRRRLVVAHRLLSVKDAHQLAMEAVNPVNQVNPAVLVPAWRNCWEILHPNGLNAATVIASASTETDWSTLHHGIQKTPHPGEPSLNQWCHQRTPHVDQPSSPTQFSWAVPHSGTLTRAVSVRHVKGSTIFASSAPAAALSKQINDCCFFVVLLPSTWWRLPTEPLSSLMIKDLAIKEKNTNKIKSKCYLPSFLPSFPILSLPSLYICLSVCLSVCPSVELKLCC